MSHRGPESPLWGGVCAKNYMITEGGLKRPEKVLRNILTAPNRNIGNFLTCYFTDTFPIFPFPPTPMLGNFLSSTFELAVLPSILFLRKLIHMQKLLILMDH